MKKPLKEGIDPEELAYRAEWVLRGSAAAIEIALVYMTEVLRNLEERESEGFKYLNSKTIDTIKADIEDVLNRKENVWKLIRHLEYPTNPAYK